MLPGIVAVVTVIILVLGFTMLAGKGKVKKSVTFLRPRDKRGEKLEITKETDRSLWCEKSDPPHRFVKVGSSFIVKNRSRSNIEFYGIEGSAYTAEVEVKEGKEPIKMTVPEYLKELFGEKIYEALPDKLITLIEKAKWGITIEPVRVDVDEKDLPNLSSDDVNDEGDAVVLNRLAKYGSTENLKQKFLGNLVWAFVGFGIAMFLVNLGWL